MTVSARPTAPSISPPAATASARTSKADGDHLRNTIGSRKCRISSARRLGGWYIARRRQAGPAKGCRTGTPRDAR